MVDLSESLTRVRSLCGLVAARLGAGWTVERVLSSTTLRLDGNDARALLADLRGSEHPADVATFSADFGSASLTVTRYSSGDMRVTDREADDDPVGLFMPEFRDAARDAWAGDVDAALSLPGSWTVTARYDLAAPLREAAPFIAWEVLAGISDVVALVETSAAWALGPLVNIDKPAIFIVEDLMVDDLLKTEWMACVPLASNTAASSAATHWADVALREGPDWHVPELPDAAHPTALAPAVCKGTTLEPLQRRLWTRCATMAWAGLATRIDLDASGQREMRLEIFGLQRVAYTVSHRGVSVDEVQARIAYEMFRWASGTDAVDQRLAVQQVASLYRDVAPWTKSADVFEASKSVFTSLRQNAVAEVLLARRNTRLLAIEVGQRTIDSGAAAARSAVERCVATLLAIGAVVVAHTTKAVTDKQAQDLRLLIGGFLLALIVWTIVIEGPAITLPIRAFKDDVAKIADVLTKTEREEVLELKAMTSAKTRGIVVRVSVPMFYLAAAITAVAVH